MAGFDWAQFRALFGAIRKGEERADNGMGKSGGTGGTSRIVSLVFSFGMIAAMLLVGGLKLGQMGASMLTAFELSVVTLVAISLTMGFYTAVSSLFFSGDIAFYLALPVGGTTIVWAKLANYMAGMMAVDLAVLPFSLGVLAGRGEGPLTWVVVVLAFLLCCVAVNVALVLVALPIVRFSKLVADKDRFARVFGLVSTVFALAIVLVTTMGAYDGADGIDAATAASMVGGIASAPVARVAFCLLCPPLALGGLTFGAGSASLLGGVLGMAALTACYVVLLSVLSGRWYFDAVRGMAGGPATSSRGRYEAAELAQAVGSRSQFKAFFSVGVAQLVRVPAFFNQFVLTMWLFPAIMAFSGMTGAVGSSEGASFDEICALAATMTLDGTSGFVLLFVTALLAFFCCLLSFTFMRSVSMDGRDFFLFRTMPCDFGSYLMAKFAALTLVGRGPVMVLLLVAFLVLGLPPVTLLAMLAFFVLATATCDLLALIIGAHKPNLGWASESELSSSGEALVLLLLSLVLSLLVMALPLACAIVPLVVGLDAGALPVLGALVLLVIEFLAIRAYACGPATRWLATIEP
ncbi:hypothetical protein ACTQV1_08195 [Paratractidigestivibacter faecalis]|uniref:hypothetical protein n=1 Tax=Paratractidigestivibacter faecalis TaxID=2292441 RepID=UPI003F99B701